MGLIALLACSALTLAAGSINEGTSIPTTGMSGPASEVAAVAPAAAAPAHAATAVTASAPLVRPEIIGEDLPMGKGTYHEKALVFGVDFPEAPAGSRVAPDMIDLKKTFPVRNPAEDVEEQVGEEGEEGEEEGEPEGGEGGEQFGSHLKNLFSSISQRQNTIEEKLEKTMKYMEQQRTGMKKEYGELAKGMKTDFSKELGSSKEGWQHSAKELDQRTKHQQKALEQLSEQQQHEDDNKSLEHHLLEELSAHMGPIMHKLDGQATQGHDQESMLHVLRTELQTALVHASTSYQAGHLGEGQGQQHGLQHHQQGQQQHQHQHQQQHQHQHQHQQDGGVDYENNNEDNYEYVDPSTDPEVEKLEHGQQEWVQQQQGWEQKEQGFQHEAQKAKEDLTELKADDKLAHPGKFVAPAQGQQAQQGLGQGQEHSQSQQHGAGAGAGTGGNSAHTIDQLKRMIIALKEKGQKLDALNGAHHQQQHHQQQ